MKLVLAILTLVSVVYCRGHVKPPDSHSSTGEEPPRVPLPDQLPFSDFTLANTEPKLTKLFNSDISTGEKDEFVHRKRKDCNSLGGQCVNKGEACPDQLSVETSLCNKSQRCCHPAQPACPTVSCEQCPTPSVTTEATTQAPVTPSPVIEACSSENGTVIGNECVFFSKEGDEIPWQDALEKCSKKYGPLVSPTDPAALLEFVATNYADIPFWVGGYSLPYEKSFRWLNDKDIPLDSKDFPWATNEPSPPIQPSDQRCMQVNYGEGYANKPCSNNQRYVCRLDACRLLGGITLGYQCLKFITEASLNWGEASEACVSDGGRLVVPAYPQLLSDYVAKEYNFSEIIFWVGGLQTDYSNEDSWYWLNGQPIPLGADNFPWADGQPDDAYKNEHCLNVFYWDTGFHGYNDLKCFDYSKYICELDTSTTQLPSPVQFVIPQILSGKYIGPNNVFPYIQDNYKLTLHITLDPNMYMAFDIVDGIWGYIRHVSSGKILTPFGNSNDTALMNPNDGTRVVLNSDRRPWALFALDQYQNRILHRSGKYIKPGGEFITISGDESNNKTMEFLFMNTTNPGIEVLPYGYPVVSGDWQLVFSVLNPIATHTYSANVMVGRSSTKSTSSTFKFGFESVTKIGAKVTGGGSFLGIGATVEGSVEQTFKVSLDMELQLASSATWKTEDEKAHSFTVEAGKSVAIWQRAYIIKQGENRAVYLSDTFADTNSSTINPNKFNGSKR